MTDIGQTWQMISIARNLVDMINNGISGLGVPGMSILSGLLPPKFCPLIPPPFPPFVP